ncbi:MAG: hypothetical protein ACPL8I_09595 [Chloroflexaceae bacterium]
MLTLVGAVSNDSTIPPIETCSAPMLNDNWIWARAMMIMGNHDA